MDIIYNIGANYPVVFNFTSQIMGLVGSIFVVCKLLLNVSNTHIKQTKKKSGPDEARNYIQLSYWITAGTSCLMYSYGLQILIIYKSIDIDILIAAISFSVFSIAFMCLFFFWRCNVLQKKFNL